MRPSESNGISISLLIAVLSAPSRSPNCPVHQSECGAAMGRPCGVRPDEQRESARVRCGRHTTRGGERMAGQPSSPLADIRMAAGYTQEGFAEKLGVDRSTVGRWERGVQYPQPWQRPDLAAAFD